MSEPRGAAPPGVRRGGSGEERATSEGGASKAPRGERATQTEAASHFSTEALGEPEGPGRYVIIDEITPAEFGPGLTFRPVLGRGAMTNFVNYEPGARAPRHVHEEEQMVIVIDGELHFDLDGDVRTMSRGDVAVVPPWVPHGAWTTDSTCLQIDVFCPPRKTLLALAEEQAADQQGRD
jgi:quercetin dioxygenase-like cupin family protein